MRRKNLQEGRYCPRKKYKKEEKQEEKSNARRKKRRRRKTGPRKKKTRPLLLFDTRLDEPLGRPPFWSRFFWAWFGYAWHMARGNVYRRSWKLLRLRILARDGYACQIKGPGCQDRATEVDHIISISEGGPMLAPQNLRAACRLCNRRRAGGSRKAHGASRRWPVWG